MGILEFRRPIWKIRFLENQRLNHAIPTGKVKEMIT